MKIIIIDDTIKQHEPIFRSYLEKPDIEDSRVQKILEDIQSRLGLTQNQDLTNVSCPVLKNESVEIFGSYEDAAETLGISINTSTKPNKRTYIEAFNEHRIKTINDRLEQSTVDGMQEAVDVKELRPIKTMHTTTNYSKYQKVSPDDYENAVKVLNRHYVHGGLEPVKWGYDEHGIYVEENLTYATGVDGEIWHEAGAFDDYIKSASDDLYKLREGFSLGKPIMESLSIDFPDKLQSFQIIFMDNNIVEDSIPKTSGLSFVKKLLETAKTNKIKLPFLASVSGVHGKNPVAFITDPTVDRAFISVPQYEQKEMHKNELVHIAAGIRAVTHTVKQLAPSPTLAAANDQQPTVTPDTIHM